MLPPRFDPVSRHRLQERRLQHYSAAVVIGVAAKSAGGLTSRFYLLEAWRGKAEFVALKRHVVKLHAIWRSHAVVCSE
jgi:hypothetical protein